MICVSATRAPFNSNVKVWPNKQIEDGAVPFDQPHLGGCLFTETLGAYGITGLTNREITPELASRIGAAVLALSLGEGAYVTTSRDAHFGQPMIKRSVITGFLSNRC